MSGKIRLAKSRDSRTRGKAKVEEKSELKLLLREQLKEQRDFVDYLLKKGYSTLTTKAYAKDVSNFEAWAEKENVPIGAVNYSDVLHYIQAKKRNVKQSSISSIVNSIKHYFNYLKAAGVLSENPVNPTNEIKVRGIKRRTLYHILKPQELEQLYESFKIPEPTNKTKNLNWLKSSLLTAKRNRVMLGLMIWQGLNTTELFRLTVKDLKLREGKIFIAGTRRSNERTLKLESVQIMDLMEYNLQIRNELLELTGKETDQLFISSGRGKHINGMMQKFMQNVRKQNPKIDSAKQIRTSVIVHWLKQYNLRQVQYMAGHRFVSSTEAYLINDLDGLSEEIEKFHPMG